MVGDSAHWVLGLKICLEMTTGMAKIYTTRWLVRTYFPRKGHVNNKTFINPDRMGYYDFIVPDLPESSTGKNTLSRNGHISNNTSKALIQQGEQMVPQTGGASTAEPRSGLSRSKNNQCKRDIR